MTVKQIKTWHIDKNGSVSLREGVQASLHDKEGVLTEKGRNAFRMALYSPIWHTPVDLGIKEFKRYLKGIPMITKSAYNEAVALYKEKGWGEYAETIKFKGSFPTVRI